MRRILFIIDSLTCGGAEKSIVSLLPLLDRTKYEVYLWIRHRGGVFESLLTENTILVDAPHYSFSRKALLKLGGWAYSIVYRIYKCLGKNVHPSELLWKCQGWAMRMPQGQWDVVIAYQQGIPTYLVATKVKGCKRMAWINANLFNAGYEPKFNAEMYKNVDRICPVSEELHAILCDRYPQFKSKYTTIYDILNPQIIKQQSEEEIDETDYNDKLAILTVGRLAPPKNHLLAVETAKVLRDKGLDFCWYFIGEGGELPKILELIQKYRLEPYVKPLGLRTNPYAYMRRCDIYVQTSSFEGFGLTIAEAKILGKPVVSTNFDVVHDQLSHEKNGLIVAMNPNDLADAIMRMHQDEKLRQSIISTVEKEENRTYITEVGKIERLLDED